MVKNLVNSIEKLVFEKSTKKFGVSRILKENDDKPVFIKNVNGYPVIGNLFV